MIYICNFTAEETSEFFKIFHKTFNLDDCMTYLFYKRYKKKTRNKANDCILIIFSVFVLIKNHLWVWDKCFRGIYNMGRAHALVSRYACSQFKTVVTVFARSCKLML